MAKKTIAQKEPVKLREKKLSNGNISLYLDIYRNGKRHKEYLKLYLIEAKTPIEREQNRQTLATAQAIKSKRLIEIQNGEYTFTHQFKEDTPFLEYYRNMVKERNTPDTEVTMATGKVACVIWSCTAMRKQLSEMLHQNLFWGSKIS